MDGLELWLVRHGETVWNASGRVQGHADTPLSERGREQAGRLAARLKGMRFDGVFSSDLSRALETAHIVATTLEGKPEVRLDPRLREIHVGAVSGLTRREAIERGLWAHREFDEPHPEGESRADLAARVQATVLEFAQGQQGRIIAFAHGGTVRAAIGVILGEPRASVLAGFGPINNTSITRFLISSTVVGRLLVFNDTAHLESKTHRVLEE